MHCNVTSKCIARNITLVLIFSLHSKVYVNQAETLWKHVYVHHFTKASVLIPPFWRRSSEFCFRCWYYRFNFTYFGTSVRRMANFRSNNITQLLNIVICQTSWWCGVWCAHKTFHALLECLYLPKVSFCRSCKFFLTSVNKNTQIRRCCVALLKLDELILWIETWVLHVKNHWKLTWHEHIANSENQQR